MALPSRDIEIQWPVPRDGGGVVTATRVIGQTVISVDRSQEAVVPPGARLLSSFLDDFEAQADIADILPEVRQSVGREFIERDGETLKGLRLAVGMSQADLAHAISTSQSRISRLEARKEKPAEDTIRDLCSALGVDANTIMSALARADQ